MRTLLDHPRPDVRGSAAIGLGLLGDASVAPRVKAILDGLPREKDEDSWPMTDAKLDETAALKTIEAH